MVLHDKLIHKWAGAEGCVVPFDAQCVNPASIDLKVADVYVDMYDGSEHRATSADPIVIYPYSLLRDKMYEVMKRAGFSIRHKPSFVLGVTQETIYIPDNMAAMIMLKTTPARKGLNHSIGAWVDPGYYGKLTLTLHASAKVVLHPGQRICQLVLHRLEENCVVSYADVGHYMHQHSPTPAKDVCYD